MREFAARCLDSIARTFTGCSPQDVEFILIDDQSDAEQGIADLFKQFRNGVQSRATLVHLKQRQYYTYAVSLGLSLSRGDLMLLISHDMVSTPSYVRTLVDVARADPTFGIIRGCSEHVDCLPQHVVKPHVPLRSYNEIAQFSEEVERREAGNIEEDQLLIGDSFMVSRAVIEKIGVMDTAYRHLYGDIDFGLRAKRAGFKLVCAKGAWLHHEGGGHTKTTLAAGVQLEEMQKQAVKLESDGYRLFRSRWDPSLPDVCGPNAEMNFAKMCQRAVSFNERVPLLELDKNICELL